MSLATNYSDLLEKLPKSWSTQRNTVLFKESKQIVGAESADYKVLALSLKGVIERDIENGFGKFPDSFDGYQIIDRNSLLLCLFDVDVTPRITGYVNQLGITSAAYTNLTARNKLNLKYYYYWFLTLETKKVLLSYCTGLRISLKENDFKNLLAPLPPPEIQNKIVEFLDSKLYKIDKFIANKQQYIEKLIERKQIVINDAVTKGTNSDKPTKLNTDWLPESPADWQVKRLKYLIKLRNENSKLQDDISTKVALENIESFTGKYIETGDPFEGNGTTFKKGDILFGKLRPYLAKVYISEFDGECVTDILPIVVDYSQMDKKFMYYRILSRDFINEVNSSTYGAKMPRANWGFIGNLSIPYPSKEEQKSIVSFIESETKNIDIAIDKTQNQIELIKEYRDSLITHAVTGQIEIKE